MWKINTTLRLEHVEITLFKLKWQSYRDAITWRIQYVKGKVRGLAKEDEINI
jgi:hypothetical protein